jgi:hypothetical protein
MSRIKQMEISKKIYFLFFNSNFVQFFVILFLAFFISFIIYLKMKVKDQEMLINNRNDQINIYNNDKKEGNYNKKYNIVLIFESFIIFIKR